MNIITIGDQEYIQNHVLIKMINSNSNIQKIEQFLAMTQIPHCILRASISLKCKMLFDKSQKDVCQAYSYTGM